MLNPDWPLSLRLVLVAVPVAAAVWFFSTGSVAPGALFAGLTAWVFNGLFLNPPRPKD